MRKLALIFTFLYGVSRLEASRILAVFPTPSISHQVAFRPLVHELAKRGHEVVVLTTDPVYSKGKPLPNLTEIDVHDMSYSIWRQEFVNAAMKPGEKDSLKNQVDLIYNSIVKIFEQQMKTPEMQSVLKQQFDLLIVEAYMLPTLGLKHIFKVPVIQMSSFMPVPRDLENLGAPNNPALYPSIFRQKIYNITLWDKFMDLYNHYVINHKYFSIDLKFEESLRRIFGPNVPSLSQLIDSIDMLFLNCYSIWDYNRPVPPSIVYLGGIHNNPEKALPQDLKSYLDSSKQGVIYLSFGTNVNPSMISPEKIQMFIRVFSRLPFDVLWKWDHDELPGKSANIRISKWLPQSDLLRHPKIKLFITQGGLQSTDEAITAGVPLIGVPMLGDQWYNVEQYVRHNIGLRLDIEDLTETQLKNAIDAVTTDVTYRQNIVKLRSVIWDQPQSPLQRAVWWTEHVLRHGGAHHLRAPAANMSWIEYYEIELLSYILVALLTTISVALFIVYYIFRYILNNYIASVKLKNA